MLTRPNLLGQYCGYKVEWTEEVGHGQIIEGLKSNRYDFYGGTIWPSADRAKLANFTTPVFFSPVGVWVRSDDQRFNTLEDLNKRSVTIAMKDNDITDFIARSSVPNAKRLSTMQMEDIGQQLVNVVNGKADAAFIEPYFASLFLRQNPKTIKNIAQKNPVRVFGNTMMFSDDDPRLKRMLDTALIEIQNTGIIQKLIEKYTGQSNTFLLPADPYKI